LIGRVLWATGPGPGFEQKGLKNRRNSRMSSGWQTTHLKRADLAASGSWFGGAVAVEARTLAAGASNCHC
jgi:hypothetical protein